MLVKVSKGDGQFLLLPDIRSIDLCSCSLTAMSGDELKEKIEKETEKLNGVEVRDVLMDIDWNKFSTSLNPKNSYRFGFMTIEHNDRSRAVVFFDHPVYLCNEAGDTIEKINIR